MTRYTKLERRQPEFVKDNTQHASARSSSSAESEASTSAIKTPATDVSKDVSREEEPATTTNPKKPEPSEPAKLLKRAKLLRLKAKKAKDVNRKQDLLKQIQELERKVNTLNGERGKGKAGTAAKAKATSKEMKKSSLETSEQVPESATSGIAANPWKVMEAERRKVSDRRSEIRREKREQERLSTQRCFACRQMGHSAKDCTTNLSTDPNQTLTGESHHQPGPGIVCCYRCGSTEHSLAKCKKSAPQVGPDLPFASCFICGENGHLASKCKQNKGRGIYPNGGSCMLCQSVDHLAKDCELRTNAAGVNTVSNAAISMGNGYGQAGADEDDFHSLSRKRREIEEAEKIGGGKKRKVVARKVVSF